MADQVDLGVAEGRPLKGFGPDGHLVPQETSRLGAAVEPALAAPLAGGQPAVDLAGPVRRLLASIQKADGVLPVIARQLA